MSSSMPSAGDSDSTNSSVYLEPYQYVEGATMTEAEQAAIAVCRDDIVRDVQVLHIIDSLMSYNVISDEEKKRIFDTGIKIILKTRDFERRQEVMRAQARSLLDIIENKNAFKYLIAALEYRNSYSWLAEKLLAQRDKFSKQQPIYKMLAKFATSNPLK